MDPIGYLTSPATDFTARAWVFFIAQIVLLGVGAYFAFVRPDANAVRKSALLQLGYGLIVLGGLGTLFGILRLASIAPFTIPLWFYVLLLVEVLFAIYAVYYSRTTYVQQLAAASSNKRSLKRVSVSQPRAAAQSTSNGVILPVTVSTPRPDSVAAGRRDSRRDRKRRSKK